MDKLTSNLSSAYRGFGAAATVVLCACSSASDSEQLPNIVYILADDLGYGDLSCYGQTKFNTPNIDNLASRGMLFTQHYSGSSVSAPSRSSLLTGEHTGHTPIRGNLEMTECEGQHPIEANYSTLLKLLKERGYTTSVVGKWGLGYPQSEGDPNNQYVDEFFGYNCQRLAHHYYPDYLWHNQEKYMLEGNQGLNKGQYAPDVIHDKAIEFIESSSEQPFFLFYASPIPHAEMAAPEECIAQFRGKFLPETSYEGVDSGERYKLGAYGSQRECNAAFAAMVTKLDTQVGEIVAKLEELNLMDNTLVIFASDNGPSNEGGSNPNYFDSNGVLRGYKRDLYEGGIRVPMIARWDGVVGSGVTTDHISAFWDVMPTIADMLNEPRQSSFDGLSMLPTLTGRGVQQEHPHLYWEFHENGGRQALRIGDWKGVIYNVSDSSSELELYNLATDVEERYNVVKYHPEIAARILAIIDTSRTESEYYKFASDRFDGDK
ncbi:MAG: arylsulfatase [Rikenellaceae bacterium]